MMLLPASTARGEAAIDRRFDNIRGQSEPNAPSTNRTFSDWSPSHPFAAGKSLFLPKRRYSGPVIEDVERRVGDDRREADWRTDPGLAQEPAGRRVDEDQSAVRAGDDQASAGQHRARIFDLALLRLRLLELLHLGDPTDVAILPIDAQQLGIVGHDEDPVAGEPRRRNSRR